MSEQEVRDYLQRIKAFTKKTASSKDKAVEFLASTGMYTRKGKLKKAFR